MKGKTEETLLLYVKQRNKCMFLPRKFKRRYERLDDNRVIGNKTFRKIIKPPLSLSLKSLIRDAINSIEKIRTFESDTAEVFNSFFSERLKGLEMPLFDKFD